MSLKDDPIVDSPSPASAGWNSDEVVEPQRTVVPRGVIGPNAIQEGLEIPLAIAEQPGAGLYGLAADGSAGAYALFKASIAKTAGLGFGDTFDEEYKLARDSMPEYVPITPGGQKLTEVINGVLGRAVQAFGDTSYQLGHIPVTPFDPLLAKIMESQGAPGNPAAGAMGQAAAVLGIIAATPGGAKKAVAPLDPIDAFKMKYPRTDAAIDASKVGKIIPRLKALDKDTPLETAQVKVMDAVNEALNEELGINPAKLEQDLSVADKMKMVIAKHGPDVPMADQIRVANAYADKFKRLQDYQDQVIASRPKLEDKSQTITVTPKGTALLSEHMQAIINGETPQIKYQGGAIDIALLTPSLVNVKKSLANVKGILKDSTGGVVVFRGQLNTPPEQPAMPGPSYHATFVTDNPYLASTFGNLAEHHLSMDSAPPAKVFPFVFRDNVIIKEFKSVDEYGNFSYGNFDAFARELGPNEVGVIRNSKDEGPAPDVFQGLAQERNDQYAFTDPSVVVPLFDFLAGPGGHERWSRDVDSWNQKMDFTEPSIKTASSDIPAQWKAHISADGIQSWYHDQSNTMIQKFSDMDDYEVYSTKDFSHITTVTSLDEAKNFVKYKFGPFKKQTGSIDLEGIEKNIPQGKKVLGKGAAAWAVANPDAAAQRAEQALDKNYKEMDEARKIFSVQTLKSIRRGFVQHDYDLQHDLAKSGPLGEQAMLRMNVEHNATMIAKTRYDKAAQNIFDDVKHGDLRILEKIIRARRIVQIDAYKDVGTVRHEGGTTGPEQAAFLASLEQKLGTARYKALDEKATAYFTEEKINLKRLLDEGLIDEALYNKLKNLNYSRTEYLDAIDPEIPITSKVKGITSIRSSGIPRLGRGKDTAVNMDARSLLVEDIARVENRIARNKTLQALYTVAENNPENGIVELSKSVNKDGEIKQVPEGWTSVGVRIEGKQQHVLMRNEYAEQFVSRPDAGLNTVIGHIGDHQLTIGTAVRTVSGSSLLRATATTYNPFFVIAGLPMDIFHLWMASKDAYSPHLPVYLAQIGKDLAATAKDAMQHKGEWEQAMQEGMGPNFMTHEARAGSTGVKSTMAPHFEKIKKILSYAGDTQDTWVRLAHRHRLIASGIPSADATAMAVHRLNYYRGGVATKFVDAMIPYTNITVNATSRAIENAAADPKGSLAKVGWLVSVAAAVKIAGMMMAPETDKAISPSDKVRNFNITFGDQYFVLDPDGNKRYAYLPIRMDQVVMPFNAAVVGGLELAEYGRVPDGLVKEAIGQVNPLSTMFPPTANAIRAYVDNYDPFRDSPIYKGAKVKPEDQVRSYAKGQSTSWLAQKVGAATGTSPMGLEAAAGQLVNTNNFWIQLMGGSLKYVFGGMDPREQAESSLQYLQRSGLSRIVKLTTPGTQMMKDLEKAEQEFGSKHAKQVRGLDELMFQFQHQQGGVTGKTIENWINAQPQEDREGLTKHAKYTNAVDKILKHYKASEGIPPRGWWVSSAKIQDEPRAQVFYNEWISADADGRKRMMEIANSLHNNGVGYLSPRFQKEFARQRQLLGDDRR